MDRIEVSAGPFLAPGPYVWRPCYMYYSFQITINPQYRNTPWQMTFVLNKLAV